METCDKSLEPQNEGGEKTQNKPEEALETVVYDNQVENPEQAGESEIVEGIKVEALKDGAAADTIAENAKKELEAAQEAEVAPDEVVVEAEHAIEKAGASEEVKYEDASRQAAEIARGEAEDTDEAAQFELVEEEAESPSKEPHKPLPTDKQGLLDLLIEISQRDPVDIRRDELTRIRKQFNDLTAEETAQARMEHEQSDAENEVVTVMEYTPNPLDEEIHKMFNAIKDKKATWLEEQEAERLANFEKKSEILDQMMALASDTDNVNRTHPRFQELRQAYLNIGEVPPQRETELQRKFKDAQEHYYDQLKINKELRDYDFRKNLDTKNALIEEAQALVTEPDVISAFRRLQELHAKWRETGPVAKEIREEVWNKFKDVSAEINKRYQTFFEERKARETENEKGKTALCERVEALDWSNIKSYAGWDQMTAEVLKAQEEWKKLGFASRRANNILFARFRETCDRFFTAKAEYYRKAKEDLNNNLAKKIALCERAEALKDSTDWRKTADELIELQKEWKTIGAVPKKQSDAVWHRFQEACDFFFDQKKATTSNNRKTEQANLKAKQEIIKELQEIDPATADRDTVIERIRELQSLWGSIGHVPYKEKDRIYESFRARIKELFSAFNVNEDRRMAAFEANLNGLQGDEAKLYRERERLMRVLESKRSEAQTIENNMGFFSSKTKAGMSMIKELEDKLSKLKADLADIEKKIAIIDGKL